MIGHPDRSEPRQPANLEPAPEDEREQDEEEDPERQRRPTREVHVVAEPGDEPAGERRQRVIVAQTPDEHRERDDLDQDGRVLAHGETTDHEERVTGAEQDGREDRPTALEELPEERIRGRDHE
jgi:hypothetical protein